MANGEGYIRSRSKGSHTITIYLGKDEKGKPRQHTTTFRGSEKDAKAEMARLIAERDQGVDLTPSKITFAELVEQWEQAHYPDLAESTAETYTTLLRTHVIPVLGGLKLRDIRPLHVEAVKAGVLRKGRSRKLALNVHRLVAAILRKAVQWQLISRNPADAVEPPKPRRFVPKTPTPEELAHLLEVADRTPYGVVARLAALTAARQGEVLRFEWRDIDWEARTLVVRGTKTEGSFRRIDLPEAAVELLREQRRCELEKRLKLGPGAICGADDSPVFTNLVGRPMDAGGLKRTWKRILRDAKVGHVRFHDLRHAAATYLLAAGAPIPAVSALLGHSRTSTTTDVYAHVLPGMGRQTADLLESLMVNTWSKAQEA